APTLCSLCEQYQPRGIDIYFVYVDSRADADSLRGHFLEHHFPCRGAIDRSRALAAACGATVTPEAVVFDSARKIVYQGRIDNLYEDFGKSRSEATTHELVDA